MRNLKKLETQLMLKHLMLSQKTSTKINLLIRASILNIEREIEEVYYKFKERNGLTDEEMLKVMKKKLSQAELTRYIETHPWAIDLPSLQGRITQLSLLKEHIKYTMGYVQTESTNYMAELLTTVIEDTHSRNFFNICKKGNFEIAFQKMPKEKIDKLLNHSWCQSTWYERLRNNCGALEEKIESVLTDGVLRGKSPQFMANELTKVSHYGYTASERIARTETSYYHNKTEMEQYEELGIKKYMWVSTLDGRTCNCGRNGKPSCAERDGKIYEVGGKDSPMPPNDSHPNCRCCVVAYFDEETKNNLMRRAKTKDGKPVVFNYKTYEEWAKDNL